MATALLGSKVPEAAADRHLKSALGTIDLATLASRLRWVTPRGLRKDKATVDLRLKDIAPSTALRHWYEHDPAKQALFANRYRVELHDPEHAEALPAQVTP